MGRTPKRSEEKPRAAAASLRPVVWLAGLGCAALVLRLLCLFELRDSPFFSVLIGDSLQYDTWARQIASGDWLGREVFYQSPLYPYLLGALYRTGIDTFGVRLLQAGLGAASCVVVAIAGRRFFDERAGLAAGALLAIYPPAIFYDVLIQKSSLDLFLVSLVLLALGACLEQPTRGWLIAAGLSLGALALNRENTRVLIRRSRPGCFSEGRMAGGRNERRMSLCCCVASPWCSRRWRSATGTSAASGCCPPRSRVRTSILATIAGRTADTRRSFPDEAMPHSSAKTPRVSRSRPAAAD
jgi:hypothetical protein